MTPLTIGSVETFQLSPFNNSLFWIEATQPGAQVFLVIANPNGVQIQLPASINAQAITVNWQVTGPVGRWYRAWQVLDSLGRLQRTLPIAFDVISSPI